MITTYLKQLPLLAFSMFLFTGSHQAAASAVDTDTASLKSPSTLVVYYSASGTTERVARLIARSTGAELFQLEPEVPYSSEDLDWTDDNSRTSREYADASLREVKLIKNHPDNFDAYDRIFIGYPIWWGIAAWPVNDFVKNNDFSGKTVIPFCTSASSPLGSSASLLQKLNSSGTWLPGRRFSSRTSADDITSWLEEL